MKESGKRRSWAKLNLIAEIFWMGISTAIGGGSPF